MLACVLTTGCVTEPSRPELEAYSSPSAIETTGGARIALQQHDGAPSGMVVITTLDFATNTVGPLVALDGVLGAPQLAGNDHRAYLTWADRRHSFGARIAPDNSLGEIFDFGPDKTTRPFAVGDRFLLVESRIRQQHARWIEADGSVGAAFAFPGDVLEVLSTSAGADVGASMIERLDHSYAIVRTDGLEIELEDLEQPGTVVVLPDGALLASYTSRTDIRLLRVARDGTTSYRTDPACVPWLVAAGARIFGLCPRLDDGFMNIYVSERDATGNVIGDETMLVKAQILAGTPVFPIGRDLLVFSGSGWPEATHFDGEVASSVLVAGGHSVQ
jgi:hypothetical protein